MKLPGVSTKDGNAYLDVRIPTGLGYARNILVVRAADAVVAISGEYGTLSEIAFAFNDTRPVIGINSWDVPGMIQVNSAQQAINRIKKCLTKNR